MEKTIENLTIHERLLLTIINKSCKRSKDGICKMTTIEFQKNIKKCKSQTTHLLNNLIKLNLITCVGKNGHHRAFCLTDFAKNKRLGISKRTFTKIQAEHHLR